MPPAYTLDTKSVISTFAGILSFGSVRNYTLISPSSPYCIFDALLRPLAGGTFLIRYKSQS